MNSKETFDQVRAGKSGARMRGAGLSPKQKTKVRKALHTLHNMEIMAAAIYRMQITRKGGAFDEALIAAMSNEMDHVRDFCAKLYEYGMRPALFRMAYWKVGTGIGLFARFAGRKKAPKTNIWIEEKACRHYQKLIGACFWDGATLGIMKKDLADEVHHIEVWKEFLKEGK